VLPEDGKLASSVGGAVLSDCRRILDAVPDPILVADAETGVVVEANQAAEELFGRARDELVGLHHAQLYPAQTAESAQALFASYVTEGAMSPAQEQPALAIVRADGREVAVEISARMATFDGRRRVVGVFRDVTAQRSTAQALRESEERLRLFMEHVPAGVFLKDEHDRLLYTNEYLTQLFGWKGGIGKTTFDLLPRALAECMVADDRLAFEQGSRVLTEHVVDAQGTARVFETHKFPLPQPGNKRLLAGIALDVTARVQAEEQARAAAREWEATFGAVGDAVWLLDSECRVRRANAVARRLFGDDAAVLGRHCWEIVHDSKRPIPDCPTLRMRLSLGREVSQVAIGDRWLEVAVDPILGDDGTLVGAVHAVSDITARVKFEAALKESEARHRVLFDQSPVAIVVATAGGEIVDANESLGDMLGYAPPQVRRLRLDDLYVDHSELDEQRAEIAQHDSVAGRDVRLRCQDGNVIDCLASTTKLSIGERVLFQTTFIDISGRRQAERALRESERGFRSLFDTMSEMVVLHELVLDSAGRASDYRILDCNPAFTSATGIARERAVGALASELYGTGEPPYLDTYARAAQTGEPAQLDVYFSGMRKHFSISVFSPQRMQFATVSTDISGRKLAEEEIRTLNAELEDRVAQRTSELAVANKELESFSYSVSHDLRAPLRAIDGFSQALQEDCGNQLDATGRLHVERVRAATQRMGVLIDDMLRLSRVVRGELRLESIDLSALACVVAEDLAHQEPTRRARVAIQDGLVVEADPRLLRVVLENLLGNAWKFTRDQAEPVIELGADASGEGAVYYVRDNGAGFDMNHVERLFAPFQRLHSDAEFPGNGIGLATVQRIVSRHGGRVWAEGAVGRGTTVYWTLSGAQGVLNA
jgi:PAS domain S-box-containing protein